MKKASEVVIPGFLACVCVFINVCFADRVVMKADVVRDYPDQCYDVANCRPRRVNESWALGPCALASCERHEADRDMILEVHYSCPRLQTRGLTTHCEMIEDLRLVFPWCCPRIICSHPLTTFTTSTTTTTTTLRPVELTGRPRHRVRRPVYRKRTSPQPEVHREEEGTGKVEDEEPRVNDISQTGNRDS